MTMNYHEVTIHKFKSNIARYLRDLDAGRWDAVVVKRYGEPVGIFFSVRARARRAAAAARRNAP